MTSARSLDVLVDASRVYGRGRRAKTIFSNLSLQIREGSRLAIMGPNGCGKSTFLRAALGIEPLTSGRVGGYVTRRDLLGAVLQNYRSLLLPWASIRTNVLLAHRDDGAGSFPPAAEVLSQTMKLLEEWNFQMLSSEPVHSLSGGQQQALVLARALAYRPRFLIWDEPVSAIDFHRREIVYRTFQCYCRDQAATAVVVTHDLDEALLLSDRILVFAPQMTIDHEAEITGPDAIRGPQFLDSPHARAIRVAIRLNASRNSSSAGP